MSLNYDKLVYNLTITKVYGGYIGLVECVKVSQLKTEGPFMLGHINYIYKYNVKFLRHFEVVDSTGTKFGIPNWAPEAAKKGVNRERKTRWQEQRTRRALDTLQDAARSLTQRKIRDMKSDIGKICVKIDYSKFWNPSAPWNHGASTCRSSLQS